MNNINQNAFLDEGINRNNVTTENGALAHSTTGSNFMDDFASAGTFRDRSFEDIHKTMVLLWNENKLTTFKGIIYLRMVIRKVVIDNETDTETVQKGQGLKDEATKRFMWVAKNDPEWFYANLLLIPLAGSWRDVWQMLCIDMNSETAIIDRNRVYKIMKAFLANKKADHGLFLKYMPLVKSRQKQKTPRLKAFSKFAVELRKVLELSSKKMRQMKTTGDAHSFQQLISVKDFKALTFNTIPGKALSLLTSGKFLSNNKLELEYLNFIQAQPTAKFTGYPYELGKRIRNAGNLSLIEEITINKQFEGLIELAKQDGSAGLDGNVWCAVDTSGSMTCNALSDGTTPYDIGIALALYFAALNEGAFKNNVIMFDDISKTLKLTGETFVKNYRQLTSRYDSMGGTNFQSVIDEICRVRRQNPMIPITDFPSTLLVISDRHVCHCV